MDKLKSRKFWICVAAFLASIGTSIAGLKSDNEIIATVGIICTILSSAIYAFAEAYVDGKAVNYDALDSLAKIMDKIPEIEGNEEGSDE